MKCMLGSYCVQILGNGSVSGRIVWSAAGDSCAACRLAPVRLASYRFEARTL